jgi:hypothetical protein
VEKRVGLRFHTILEVEEEMSLVTNYRRAVVKNILPMYIAYRVIF